MGGGAPVSNNDTIGHGEQAWVGGAPAISNDNINRGEQAVDGSDNNTIGRGEQAVGGGAPAISNDNIKLLSEEIKELKKMLYEQQQLQSRDEKICILESRFHDMTNVMNTIVEHIRDQRTNSIPDEFRRNELYFHIGCTTSTHTSRSLLSFNSIRQNYNDDNSNKETHETSNNEENDGHSKGALT